MEPGAATAQQPQFADMAQQSLLRRADAAQQPLLQLADAAEVRRVQQQNAAEIRPFSRIPGGQPTRPPQTIPIGAERSTRSFF